MPSSSSIYIVWAQHMKGCRSLFVKAFVDKSLAEFTNQTMGTFANNPFVSGIKSGGIEYPVDLEKDAKYVWVAMCMFVENEFPLGAFATERLALDHIDRCTKKKGITFSIVQTEINRSELV